MFYTYMQNNSGGRFIEPALYVIVEADDAVEANNIAESLGLYFDGSGDCPCCGDRWYAAWRDEEGTAEPTIYGQPIDKADLGMSEGWAAADGVPVVEVFYRGDND